ncbi:MAG: arsenite efflux transporter metallochaperone ArsD [Bacilli bacterium]
MDIVIFDPEMCCSTGVCGASPDPELIRVGELVEMLKERGHQVTRRMLSRNPEAFSGNPQVYELLKQQGMKCLPIVTVDGVLHSVGQYPTLDGLLALRES